MSHELCTESKTGMSAAQMNRVACHEQCHMSRTNEYVHTTMRICVIRYGDVNMIHEPSHEPSKTGLSAAQMTRVPYDKQYHTI